MERLEGVDHVEAQEESLSRLRNKWAAQFSNAVKDQTSVVEESASNRWRIVRRAIRLIRSHRKELGRHVGEMQQMEITFREGMKLRAPVQYWQSKTEKHEKRGNEALGAFCVFAAAAVFGAAFVIPEYYEKVAKIGGDTYFGIMIAFGFPAVLVLWILRHVSRIFVSNHRLAEDAAFRAIQTETYLALMADEKAQVSNDDRLLILNALFRPMDSHGSEDDSLPPNLLEILRKRSN